MNEKRENQQKIIAAINNDFNLFFDQGQFTLLDEYLLPEDSIGYNNVENFAEILAITKEYIRNHSYEFKLGDNSSEQNVCEGRVEGQKPETRQWWSPLITDDEAGRGRNQGPHGVCRTRKIMKGNFFIHPAALTGAQYEELKQEIPSACKVRGCCNNYSDPSAHDVRFTMVGNVCQYHYLFPDHRPPFFAGKTCGDNSVENNTTQSVQFTIKEVDKPFPDFNIFYLRTNPFTVNGSDITRVIIEGDKVDNIFQTGVLQSGNAITITGIEFELGRVSIDNGNELFISSYFANIQVVDQTSVPPINPTLFPDVKLKNKEITVENDKLALLAFDLMEIIDKNNKLVQKAKVEKKLSLLALTNPDGSALELDDFESKPLEVLNENQSLNSVANQKLLTENQKNKQRKEKFANHLKKIYQKNQIEYQKASTQSQENSLSLENIKTAAIFQIESKQVDMNVLENGKYQNFQSVIENFSKEEEIEIYKNEILAAIAQTNEEQENNNRNIPKKNQPLIDKSEKEIIKASSLEGSREKAIANFKIFLAKLGVKENEINFGIYLNGNEKAKGSDFQACFKKLNGKREILEFYKQLKKETLKHIMYNHHNEESKSPKNKLLIPILICSFIVLIFLVGLVLIGKSQKRPSIKRI